MVLPGHLAGGYLATKALLGLSPIVFSPRQKLAIFILGLLSSEGPDSDLMWFYIVHKLKLGADQSHRDYVTHAPIVWLGLSFLIFIIGLLANSIFIEFIGWAVLCGSWSHFILDSIEYGIMWLWPFSRKRFALIYRPEEKVTNEKAGTVSFYWNFIKNVYLKQVTFWAELLITVIALISVFR